MKIAACYIRVSTDDQLEYSPDSQLKVILDYAAKNGYIIPDEYIFRDEGISGKRAANRPEFNKMIAYAKSKERPFECILLWKFSRFARNQEEAILYKNLLRKHSVEVKSVSEPVIEGAFGDLIERIIEWMDEFYVINLASEVKRGMLEKASRGEVLGPAPFGYINKDKTYSPSPDAEYVKDIFESFVAGEPQSSIARRLNAAGVRTKRGNALDVRFINYVLHNPAYIGKIRWSKEGRAASKRDYYNESILTTNGSHEPLITEKIFNKAQKLIKENERKHKAYSRSSLDADYRWKGLIRCSNCGATLCRLSNENMQCHKYAKAQCNVSHHLSMAKADEAIGRALEEAVLSNNFNLEYREPQTNKKEINYKKLLDMEEHKLEKIREAYEKGIDTLEEYAARKQYILSNIDAIKAAEKVAPKPQRKIDKKAFKRRIASVLKSLRSPAVSEAEKNAALKSILDHITYNKSTSTFTLYFYI